MIEIWFYLFLSETDVFIILNIFLLGGILAFIYRLIKMKKK